MGDAVPLEQVQAVLSGWLSPRKVREVMRELRGLAHPAGQPTPKVTEKHLALVARKRREWSDG